MSKEQANEFLKKVSADKAAAEKFKEAFRAALVKAGKDAGFKFTREELDAVLTQLKSEIPEGDLKGVAAAGHYCTPPDPCQPCNPMCQPSRKCGPDICAPLCSPNPCYPNGH